MLSRVWHSTANQLPQPLNRPWLAWSGEGGSVGLGYVHMNQAIVDLMRAGNIEQAIEEFFRCEYVHIPLKLFRPKTLRFVAGCVKEGVKAELDEFHSSDRARNFYLF